MAKPGRNDRCPCGSGKKYKACCLTRDEAAELERLSAQQAERDERTAAKRHRLAEERAAMIAKLSGAEDADDWGDALMAASNAVVDLVHAGQLDEAEAAARALLARCPEVHDGYDRLGMVLEARGDNAKAADCYRKVVEFLRQNPDYADPGFMNEFVERIAKLDPPAAG